ncbi:Bug family tripartite tricarboxylate transporter substrate binding protein [Hydrogenophaga sp.]|uniref:Bug family tripartite tricarboxylate transporter substrate binding protein n=1 Tax=Hydrogenophaga sp. TaxID=1904254 RepID=UPI002FCB39DE
MTTLPRRRMLNAMLAWAGVAALRPVDAQPHWPSKPLRIIVVYPPGGLSDGVARSLAERLSQQLGVPVRVENRSGGGGSVGLQALARAEPDGHTLAFSAVSPLTLRPHQGVVGHDPLRDIEPVASVMYTPVLLVGTPAFSGHSFADVLSQARARPEALRWATSGLATAGHLVLEQVQLGSGIVVTHIPYKGGGQQLTDALGGQFELLSTNVAPAQLRHIEAGHFKPLAVGAPQRLDVLPQVPTFTELGLPHANVSSLFGLFAPGGTPPMLLDRWNTEINQAVQAPEIRERLLASDNLPAIGDRPAFVRRIAEEWRSNRRLKSVNVRME